LGKLGVTGVVPVLASTFTSHVAVAPLLVTVKVLSPAVA